MESEKDERQDDLDWERRTLCSDESCIGVIGADGRCNECGIAYGGEPSEKDSEAGAEEKYVEDNAFETGAPDDEDADATSDVDWEHRTLCSDESCIGVIGPDGRCNECGKPLKDR